MPEILGPGQSYGLANAGYPPATITRDADGRYYIERLTRDLRRTRREEISAIHAAAWIEADQAQ